MAINEQSFMNLDILRGRYDESNRVLSALIDNNRPSIVTYVENLKASIEVINECMISEMKAILAE